MKYRATTIATYTLLAGTGAVTFLFPAQLTVPTIEAATANTVRIQGIVRDFKASHADFDVVPSGGTGHYAGNVSQALDDRGRPAFVPITNRLTNFTVSNQLIIPGSDFAVQLAVLGGQIYTGVYHEPVTARIRIGSDDYDLFGAYHLPVNSNLNDDQSDTGNVNPGANPRTATVSSVFPAGTSVAVIGKTWTKIDEDDSGLQNSHWESHIEASTADNSDQIVVLVNGDPVPDIDGNFGQASVAEFVEDYIDYDTGTIVLGDHQAIFLYELGTTDGGGDFQDLVVLMSLAQDPAYFDDGSVGGSGTPSGGYKVTSQWKDADGNAIAPHLYANAPTDACGNPIADTAGTAGAVSSGGISSSDSFDQWFRDQPGVNLSVPHGIDLVDNGAGVYEYATDEFHPIDGHLYGNEGEPHNTHFTFNFDVTFVYDQCTNQFAEFAGGDGAWVYINNQLAIDLGGVGAADAQKVALDRLGLTDGETYTLSFFFAQRDPNDADFSFRTNLLFGQGSEPSLVSSMFD